MKKIIKSLIIGYFNIKNCKFYINHHNELIFSEIFSKLCITLMPTKSYRRHAGSAQMHTNIIFKLL